ncbi:nucleotidyl transferase AbiEii/AbiGii toxin family protein [Candidatus Nomurabacteria bacterium]|nr:nucleotidyl transferase AbiEii/AbiGii toxin family protein [Candidatus Nomurabacteria bacterium]
MSSILSKNQVNLLTILSNEKLISDSFYLSGGTALAEFYLQHRLSEDLDFFSEQEFDPIFIFSTFKKIQDKARILKVNYEQSFNRNLFFLELNEDNIKTEFTYFPFTRIESKKKFGSLYIDSLIDIAVNKIFTIYQKPRSRDFIDLYFILMQEKSWNIDDLIKKAQLKFDTHINPIQLSSQFVKAEILKDYPNMIKKIDPKEWQGFFMKEAKRLAESRIE